MKASAIANLALWVAPTLLLGQSASPPTNLINPAGSNLEDAYQVNYAANLNIADGVVNVTNAGGSAGATAPTSSNTAGDICANVYVYQPNEQLAACCSCLTTPNGLYAWPVIFGPSALLTNVANKPNSVVIKLVATSPGTDAATGNPVCDATFQTAPLSLVPGLAAWGTHPHRTPTSAIGITETVFDKRGLSLGEAMKLQNDCNGLGTGGQCPTCLNMGLARPTVAATGPSF